MGVGKTVSALAGFLVAASAGACAADGEPTTTAATPATATVAAMETVVETAPAESQPAPLEEPAAEASELRFQGDGDRTLPPIKVRRGGSRLRWTNDGEVFSVFGERDTIVDSVAERGEAFLSAGVHRLEVIASGRWVIVLPRARRLR